MANTYHKIYLHAVFSVKYRRSLITKPWNKKLFGVIGNLINESDCKTLIVNGVEDHVHCFFSMRPINSPSGVLKTVKAKSSKYVNDHSLTVCQFNWQDGFGIFSCSAGDVDRVFKYIQNQEEHHKKISFREEYLGLLNEFKIEYDERYLFREPI